MISNKIDRKIDKNKETYISSNIVRHYAQLNLLQPAEQTILNIFQDRLSAMKMLDIGIGGGRTTQHFAPLAQEYIGIDYSPEMISASQQRFPNISSSIQIGDARDMSQFADDSFDFILFSFNGIDYVSHSDRLQILQEIHRVGKSGSYFFFSTHNLQAMIKEFNLKSKLSLNPLKTYENLMMLGLMKLFNFDISGDRLKTSDYLVIKDESHNFRLQTYYIHPPAQIKQLSNLFNKIEIYSWQSGLKISELDGSSITSDLWLYYLCINNK
jgi:ubiquinone/menaquinone biosynthesis C-methylase UbiE